MEPAVEPESLPVCAQVLKWNLGAGKDVQVWFLCGAVMDGDVNGAKNIFLRN